MPSRGSYQVASREEGKAAERDQSYRSCIIALLVFFLLCILLIVACLPWKTANRSAHDRVGQEEDLEYAQHHGEGFAKGATKTTTEATTNATTTKQPEGATESFVNDKSSSQLFERYIENATETPETTVSTSTTSTLHINVNISVTEVEKTSEYYESSTVEADERFSTYEARNDSSTSSENAVTELRNYTSVQETTESSTVSATTSESNETSFYLASRDSNDATTETSRTYVIPSSTSENTGEYTSKIFEQSSTTVADVSTTVADYTSPEITSAEPTTTATSVSFIENITGPSDSETTSPKSTTIASGVSREQTEFTEDEGYTLPNDVDAGVCDTGHCKQVASRMLSYMNHSADPCEDFYEYACGGMEADPQIVDKDLTSRAYQRIARQMKKENRDRNASPFTAYYDSCMQYDTVVNYSERIRLVKEVLNEAGKFYTTADWPGPEGGNITNLIAKLLLNHSPLLFDVVPVIDDYHKQRYTLRIGPTIFKSPLATEDADDTCILKEEDSDGSDIDLDKRYKEYKECKYSPGRLVRSISEALKALDVFHGLNNTFNETQYIDTTVISIDIEIIQNYLSMFPPANVIRDAYLLQNYSKVQFGELQADSPLVDWPQLLLSLTSYEVISQAELQVYFYRELITGLKRLDEFNKKSPMVLNNALLGLYARNLYEELVVPKVKDRKSYCLRVAANQLNLEATNLYIRSFSDQELAHMNKTITRTFDELKETLKLATGNADWVADNGLQALLGKIESLKLALPDIEYYKDFGHVRKEYKHYKLSNNYLENSMTVMRKYRTSMYSDFHRTPDEAKQVWTQYATPFQSKGLAIYSSNLVAIPFGSVDWPMTPSTDESSFAYLTLATLGSLIAHQIGHHFDKNGIHYSGNGIRDNEYTLLNADDMSSMNYENYVQCQKEFVDQEPTTMVLPMTGQTVTFKIPQLNDRLAEMTGLRLAHDTLVRLSASEKRLPWLSMEDGTPLDINQLFYLAYAQMHCTKAPLASSYVALHEDEQLPSRILVHVSATSNRDLGNAWRCPHGSPIVPSDICNVFPYLAHGDDAITSE